MILWEFVNCASNRVLAWIFGYIELDYDPIELFFLAFYLLSIEETDASMEEIVCYYFLNSPFSRFVYGTHLRSPIEIKVVILKVRLSVS